jgi:hypothetical protein
MGSARSSPAFHKCQGVGGDLISDLRSLAMPPSAHPFCRVIQRSDVEDQRSGMVADRGIASGLIDQRQPGGDLISDR